MTSYSVSKDVPGIDAVQGDIFEGKSLRDIRDNFMREHVRGPNASKTLILFQVYKITGVKREVGYSVVDHSYSELSSIRNVSSIPSNIIDKDDWIQSLTASGYILVVMDEYHESSNFDGEKIIYKIDNFYTIGFSIPGALICSAEKVGKNYSIVLHYGDENKSEIFNDLPVKRIIDIFGDLVILPVEWIFVR